MKNLHDKLMSRGASTLSDVELLAMLVESNSDQRNPLSVAETLLATHGSLTGVARCELSRLRMSEGIGLRRAERLIVAAEFGRRIAQASTNDIEYVRNDADVAQLMRPLFVGMQHEECWVLYLTSSNRLIERQRLSQGGVQATVVDHRLIIKRALELLATQLIMVHNHPSGSPEPSTADKELTKKVKSAAALFDIRLLDHVIISREGNFSFHREGIL